MSITGKHQGCCCHKDHLTSTQIRVIELVAAGRSNDQIGRRLHMSRHTVTTHLLHAMHRLDAANRTEVVARCYVFGLLRPGEWPPVATGQRCIGEPEARAMARL